MKTTSNNANKKYSDFIFYAGFKEGVERLPQKQGDQLLRMIVTYGASEASIKCDQEVTKVFEAYKPLIDFSRKHKIEKTVTDDDRPLLFIPNEEMARIDAELDEFMDREYKTMDPIQAIGLARGHEIRKR